MSLATADFEAGTLGASVLATDWGSATPWDVVNPGAGSSITYSNTQKYGRLSAKLVSTAACYMEWTTKIGSLVDHYGRMYYYGAPSAAAGVLLIQAFQSASNAWRLVINGGPIRIVNSGFTNVATGTTTISDNKWWRFEWHVLQAGGTAGNFQVRIFSDADSPVPTETLTANGASYLSSIDQIQIGNVNANANTQYLDGIVVGASDWPGPIVTQATVPGPPVLRGRSGSW